MNSRSIRTLAVFGLLAFTSSVWSGSVYAYTDNDWDNSHYETRTEIDMRIAAHRAKIQTIKEELKQRSQDLRNQARQQSEWHTSSNTYIEHYSSYSGTCTSSVQHTGNSSVKIMVHC